MRGHGNCSKFDNRSLICHRCWIMTLVIGRCRVRTVCDGRAVSHVRRCATTRRNRYTHTTMRSGSNELVGMHVWPLRFLSQLALLHASASPSFSLSLSHSLFSGLVVYGCGNERFGGCGSVLTLHTSKSLDDATAAASASGATSSNAESAAVAASASPCPAAANATMAEPAAPATASSTASAPMPPLQGSPYPCIRGVMATSAVEILKRFYARGNQNIPLEKRHRKGVAAAAATAAAATAAATVPAASAGPSPPPASAAKKPKL